MSGDRLRASVNDVPLRDAATVMLVRDGSAGLEVFMVRRTKKAAFAGGAYVFPGGSVDDDDRHGDLERYCVGRSDVSASEILGIESGGLAFWVAAVRESFEEAGVLLAVDAGGDLLRFDGAAVQARFGEHRRAVHRGERRLVDVCEDEGIRLAVDGIHYFSHWVTPRGQPRRFDTRFFVARAPEAQEPLHDAAETVESQWIRPDDAIADHRNGEIDLILPTIRNLMALARFDTADDLLAAAAAAGEIPTMEPRVVADSFGYRIVLPGDPGYDDARVPKEPLEANMPLPGRPGGPSIEGLVS